MHRDARGGRVAVVPDSIVNPLPGGQDHLVSLAADGWGVIALWPRAVDASAQAVWVEAVVEEVITLLDDGYEVALVQVDDPAIQEFVTALKETGREVTCILEPHER